MVALSTRFAFLAMLCSLTALSMTPLSEAAVLQLRTSHPPSMETKSNIVRTRRGASISRDHYAMSSDSRMDTQEEDKIYAPLLRMPKSAHVPQKKTNAIAGSGGSGGKSDRKSSNGLGGDESKHISHDGQGLFSKKEQAKYKGHYWNLSRSINQLKDFLGEKLLSDYHSVCSPDHHHHHHHHHHHRRRGRMNWGSENGRIISKNNEHFSHLRLPYYHHEKVIASGKRGQLHSRRSPHHDHHYHHGHHDHHDRHHDGYEEVDVSGDNDPVHVHRSVSINGERGQSYILPHVAKRALTQKSFSLSSLGKRSGEIDGPRGRIDIVSPAAESDEGKRLASLFLAPSDSSLDKTDFVLNASETNSTEVYIIPASSLPSEYDTIFPSDEIGVTIQIPMFDRASASISQYCATFDPTPSAPSPLRAQKCTNDPVGENQSQLFAFNLQTGNVRPMWFDEIDGMGPEEKGDCSADVPPTPQNASMAGATEAETKNKTSTSSTMPRMTGNSTVLPVGTQAASSNSSGSTVSDVQKVALLFVPADPEVMGTPSTAATVTSTSSVLATSTGAGASGGIVSTANSSSTTMVAGPSLASGTLAATSPAMLMSASGSSSVSVSVHPSAASNAAVSALVPSGTPSSLSASAVATPESKSTLTTMLGVQVVPMTEGGPSTSNPAV